MYCTAQSRRRSRWRDRTDARGPKLLLAGLVLAVQFAMIPAVNPAVAQDRGTSVYLVSGIEVDVTAATAAEARDEALGEGQARALVVMMRRLTRAVDWSLLPALPPEEAERFVLDFKIDDERTSDVRYLARLNVRFKPDAVREALVATGLPFAETPSLPVVILPILRQGGATLLWEDSNLWRAAWSNQPGTSGLVPLMVPFGDLSDMQAITPQAALRGDRPALRRIASNYRAEDSLIAIATITQASRPSVEVSLTRIGATNQPPIEFSLSAGAGEDDDALLHRAAETAAERIQDLWVSANVPRSGQEQAMMVQAQYDGLASWVALRERLAGVAAVSRSRVRMLSRHSAQIEIAFAGSFDQLATAMAQSGLLLTGPRQVSPSRFGPRDGSLRGLPILRLGARR